MELALQERKGKRGKTLIGLFFRILTLCLQSGSLLFCLQDWWRNWWNNENIEALCDFSLYHAAVNGKADVLFSRDAEDGYTIAVGHKGKEYIFVVYDSECPLHDALAVSDVAERYYEYEDIQFSNPIHNRILFQTMYAYGKRQAGRLSRLNREFRTRAQPASLRRVV